MKNQGIPDDELIVDSFCGGGGASEGIRMATGRDPDVAINHDPEAVTMHQANHPDTEHHCQSIYKVDPYDVVLKHRKPVGLAWFSPDCTHHSKARGGKPKEKHIRDLAWIVVHWAERAVWDGKRPRLIFVENVEEFQDWGPLLEDGKPCPVQKGLEFRRWVKALKKLGYKVEWRELRACDYGAPTIRKRLFVVARCDGKPIVWPEASHGKEGSGLLPYRTAAECIDFSLPCPSIFLTKEEGKKVRAKRPLAPATLRRAAHGIHRFVLNAKEPFIINLTHQGGERNEATSEPFKTITGANRGEKALCTPFIARTAHGDVDKNGKRRGKGQHPITDPLGSVTASRDFAVVQPFLAGCGGRAGQSAPRPVGKPYHTTTAKADTCLVSPFITKFRTGSVGHDLREPAHTITAGGKSARPAGAAHAMGLISPILAGAGGPIYSGRPTAVDKPFRTVTKENHTALYVPYLTEHANASNQRLFPADEPLRTHCAGVKGGHFALCGASLLEIGYGEREGQRPRAIDPEKPLGTAVAGGKKHAVAAAYLAQHNGRSIGAEADTPAPTVMGKQKHSVTACFLAQHNNHNGEHGHVGRSLEQPASTITQSGSHQGLIASSLVKLRGTCRHGQPTDEPMATVSAQGTHIAHTAAILTKYYGNDQHGEGVDTPIGTVTGSDRFGLLEVDVQPPPLADWQVARAHAVADLMREHGLWDDREFVTLDLNGATYIIVDIGMRMLTKRELFNAQGFRLDYIIDPIFNGKPMTNTAAVRMCGNSVSPPPACAMIVVNIWPAEIIEAQPRRRAA